MSRRSDTLIAMDTDTATDETTTDRRSFLRIVGVGAAALAVTATLTACPATGDEDDDDDDDSDGSKRRKKSGGTRKR